MWQFLNWHTHVSRLVTQDSKAYLPTLGTELSLRRPNTSFSAKGHGEAGQCQVLRLSCWSATALCDPLPLPPKSLGREATHPAQLNRPLHPATATPLTGDATTGLQTLLLLFKAVLVAIATAIGEAGTVFTEWVVIPARDVLLAGPSVWQFCTEPCRKGARKGTSESKELPMPPPCRAHVTTAHPPPSPRLKAVWPIYSTITSKEDDSGQQS